MPKGLMWPDGIVSISPFRIDDCLVVKRVQCIPGNKLQIISDNKNYDSYQIDLSDESQDIIIIGKVVWYGRSIGVE